MHPICGTHWEAKLHTETSTLVSILCAYDCFYCFYCVLLLFVFLVFIPSAFVCLLLSFLFIPSCAFACVICKALRVAVGYEMCYVKKIALPYIHTYIHPVWLLCQWANQMPQLQHTPQPPTETHKYSIYSKHRSTHIHPAVIRGHNPSCLSGM